MNIMLIPSYNGAWASGSQWRKHSVIKYDCW